MILNQFNSDFSLDKILPGTYTIKDISEALYTKGDHEGTLPIEYYDNTVRTKLTLNRFGGILETLRFDEKAFCNCFIGFYTVLGL